MGTSDLMCPKLNSVSCSISCVLISNYNSTIHSGWQATNLGLSQHLSLSLSVSLSPPPPPSPHPTPSHSTCFGGLSSPSLVLISSSLNQDSRLLAYLLDSVLSSSVPQCYLSRLSKKKTTNLLIDTFALIPLLASFCLHTAISKTFLISCIYVHL